jgi:hypothetical protein
MTMMIFERIEYLASIMMSLVRAHGGAPSQQTSTASTVTRHAKPPRAPAACGPYNYGKKLIRDEVNAGFRKQDSLT